MPETTLRTQRNSRFCKHEKSVIFGILTKLGSHEIFWKTQILEMSESEIFCAKLGAVNDAVIENWLRLFFAEILAFPCPKNALQNAPEKPIVNALFRKPVRTNGDSDITETYEVVTR